MKFLKAPWRWEFIRKAGQSKKCIFCSALDMGEEESLILHRGRDFFIILNLYPYTSGHLMIVPFRHASSPEEMSPTELVEMFELMNRAIGVLKKRFKPDGFNIGMNIGAAAGAGVKDHFHLHIVPRWAGDANFMAVIGDTKVVSYEPAEIQQILREELSNGSQ